MNTFAESAKNKLFFRVLIAVVSGILLLIIAEHTVGKNMAKRAVARITMPFLALPYTSKAEFPATAVIIDQRSLDEAGETWPPSYEFHARNLLAIGSYHPKAVFVDIIFTDERKEKSVQRLIDAACKLKNQGTHVIFAADTSSGEAKIRTDLMNSGCIELASAEANQDIFDMQSWNYLLQTHMGRSAALALYEDVNSHAKLEIDAEHPALMSLVWPYPTHQDSNRIETHLCDSRTNWNLLSTLKIAMLADAKKPCLPFPTFFEWELQNTNSDVDVQAGKNIRDAVVLIGTNLIGIPDKISSPINGLIPGVFLHAVAYDNLSTYQTNWKRTNGLLEHGGIRGIFWTILMIGITVAVLMFIHEKVHLRNYLIFSGKTLDKMVITLTGLLLAIAMMWVSHSLLNIGLLVYAEIISATAAAHFLHIGESIVKLIPKKVSK